MQTSPRDHFLNFAALITGTAAATQVAWYLWRMYFDDPGGFGFLLFFLLGPAAITGAILLIKYRADVRRDPDAVVAALLAGCVYICIAAIPEAVGALGKPGSMERRIYLYLVAGFLFLVRKKPATLRVYHRIRNALLYLFAGKQGNA